MGRAQRPAPTFFATPDAFRAWLDEYHDVADELWVGFFKKDSGRPSLTWPESVEQALCYGWIDGIRKRIDEERYTIRFTPRKRGSIWSAVNIRIAKRLLEAGHMRAPGVRAFEARREHKSAIYSYEQRPVDLPDPYAGLLKKNKAAWKFFQAQPPGYRKIVCWWIVSAKREETRRKRLETLTTSSARGERLPGFAPTKR